MSSRAMFKGTRLRSEVFRLDHFGSDGKINLNG